MQNNKLKWFYLIVLSIIWGTSFILIKKALLGVTAYQLGALRVIITSLFLFLIGFKTLKNIPKTAWIWITISAFTGTFFPSFFFAIAETEIDSAVASILNSLVPLNTIIFGVTLFSIQSTKRQVFGVIIGFIGTAFLILEGADLNPKQNYLYAGFVIVATILYAINVNIIKRYLYNLSPLTIATGNFASIFIPACIVLLFTDFFNTETFSNPNFNSAILYLCILSLFGTAMAKIVFNKLVHISTPVFASSVTYIMPIIALIWGVLDGESFSFLQAIASCIILFGVYLANRKNKTSET